MNKYIITCKATGTDAVEKQVAIMPADNIPAALTRFGDRLPSWSYRFGFAYFYAEAEDIHFIGTDTGVTFYAYEF